MHFVDLLVEQELTITKFADGTAKFVSHVILLVRVDSSLAQALFVSRKPAKSAVDHLTAIVKDILTTGALLDGLFCAHGATQEEDPLLMIVVCITAAHFELG